MSAARSSRVKSHWKGSAISFQRCSKMFSVRASSAIDVYRFDNISGASEIDVVAENPNDGTDELEFDGLTFAQPLAVNLAAADQALANIAGAQVRTAQPGQALNFEDVEGGAGNDTLTGNAAANTLQGRDGNDVIVGGLGDDVIRGGLGSDRLDRASRGRFRPRPASIAAFRLP
jgi:Ca2+-binding RTX toxin-like protein